MPAGPDVLHRPLATTGWLQAQAGDDTNLAWRLDGPVELLLDGGLAPGAQCVVMSNGVTCDEVYFEPIWEAIAAEVPVLRWHYRGHGRSGDPIDPLSVSVPAFALDLESVLAVAGATDVILVGHSFGVQLSAEACRNLGERVIGLVAVAGAFEGPLPTVGPMNPGVLIFDLMRLALGNPLSRRLWPRTVARPGAYALATKTMLVGRDAPKELMDRFFGHLASRDMKFMFRIFRAMQEHSPADVLSKVEAPAVILMGGRDWGTPPRFGRKMQSLMKDARVEVVPGATHTLPIERPEKVIAAIREVISRAEDRESARQ